MCTITVFNFLWFLWYLFKEYCYIQRNQKSISYVNNIVYYICTTERERERRRDL